MVLNEYDMLVWQTGIWQTQGHIAHLSITTYANVTSNHPNHISSWRPILQIQCRHMKQSFVVWNKTDVTLKQWFRCLFTVYNLFLFSKISMMFSCHINNLYMYLFSVQRYFCLQFSTVVWAIRLAFDLKSGNILFQTTHHKHHNTSALISSLVRIKIIRVRTTDRLLYEKKTGGQDYCSSVINSNYTLILLHSTYQRQQNTKIVGQYLRGENKMCNHCAK